MYRDCTKSFAMSPGTPGPCLFGIWKVCQGSLTPLTIFYPNFQAYMYLLICNCSCCISGVLQKCHFCMKLKVFSSTILYVYLILTIYYQLKKSLPFHHFNSSQLYNMQLTMHIIFEAKGIEYSTSSCTKTYVNATVVIVSSWFKSSNSVCSRFAIIVIESP